MATPNVALAEKIIEAINARDAGALLAIADDDIEVVPLRAALEWTTYRGEDGVIRLMHDLAETWDELHFELEEAREVRPGSVLGLATIHGRGHASALPTEMPIGLVARIRDGLVVYAAVFTDRAEAERAAASPSR